MIKIPMKIERVKSKIRISDEKGTIVLLHKGLGKDLKPRVWSYDHKKAGKYDRREERRRRGKKGHSCRDW